MADEGIADAVVDNSLTLTRRVVDNISGALKNFTDPENLSKLILGALMLVLVFVLAKLLLAIISSLTGKAIKKSHENPEKPSAHRVESLMTLTRSAARYVVYFGAITCALYIVGMGDATSKLFAGAGIGALAIGFGAQNLVKDVVTGIFLMFENQFSVGDYIKTGEDDGIVEAIALRVTYLRTFKGNLVIIPNGTIERVINYTRGGYMATVDVGVSYKADARAVINVINEAVQNYADENEGKIAERPKVLGISSFEDSYLKVRVVCHAKSMMQWDVERGLRLAIKEAFDGTGIEFPAPRMTFERERKRDVPVQNRRNDDLGDHIHRPIWQLEDINLEGGDTDDAL